MSLLTLYAGLLLPWLAGTLWLVFAESTLAQKHLPNRFRQTGYGFFLGYALLFLVIMSSNMISGAVSWFGVMLFFLLINVGGCIALWINHPSNSIKQESPQKKPVSNTTKLLITILLIWMTLHLVFMAIEVFTQPVYPWDAWTVWVYRAKTWFLTGEMTSLVSSADWALANSAETYTTAAWSYPLFPSVIPYWAALSLGNWSETLINLPVLFAALAIGMALYGLCRESGFSVALSLVSCYLLYSIPLFGTHVALAGYADIWMAGFTGLGFIALILGAIRIRTDGKHGKLQIILGLLMTGFGILVKNEGLVWFLSALVMLTLVSFHPRVLLLFAAGLIASTSMLYMLDITTIQIPLVGAISYNDSQISIPYVGNISLTVNNVWIPYLRNFFLMGNWNLMWLLLLATLSLSLKSPKQPENLVSLVFVGILSATQIFIFGFTDSGQWAEDFTSINRLLLHFTPTLLFVVLVTAYPRFEQQHPLGSMSKAQNVKP